MKIVLDWNERVDIVELHASWRALFSFFYNYPCNMINYSWEAFF